MEANEKTLDEAFCEAEIGQNIASGNRLGSDEEISLLNSESAETGLREIHVKRERLKNASALNEMMCLYSSCSNLVITNMPQIQSPYSCDFFDYVDTMCDGLDNCLLIRGSGKEVVTNYA
jgi:hypothetical protein